MNTSMLPGGIDFRSPEFITDPYPYYDRLRASEPIYPLGPGAWLVTRYLDADRILRDPRFGKDFLGGMMRRYGRDMSEEPAFRMIDRFLLLMNPPEHTRLRLLVSRAFGIKQAGELQRLAMGIAEQLIDGFIHHGRADLLTVFAYPLPVHVICFMLGIGLQDSRLFQEETQALLRVFELSPLDGADIDAANGAASVFEEYFRSVCRERRRRPGNDLISLLLLAEEGSDRLSEDEIIANVVLLFLAGHETTANMLGNALLALHLHGEQLAAVKSDRTLIPRAVTECLRYDSSVQIAARVALEKVDLGQATVQTGDTIYINLGAANRDPEVFEEPDRFMIQRPARSRNPLSFGGGVHYCLGARLARIELETALEALFRRLPRLKIEELDRPRRKPTTTIRGLESLTASW
jgi:cytochrome P450